MFHELHPEFSAPFLAAMQAALRDKSYASEIKFDIIFMAPAVRVDVFAETLANFGDLIGNFRSFEMSDALESTEILLQFDRAGSAVNPIVAQIYTSSLLYFISGSLEGSEDDTPVHGMNRYFLGTGAFSPGNFPQIDAVQRFYSQRPHPVVLSDTSTTIPQPPIGQRSTSHHHGGFPADDISPADGTPYAGGTLQSVCYLLKTNDYS